MLKFTVCGKNTISTNRLTSELRAALGDRIEAQVLAYSENSEPGEIVFIEAGPGDLSAAIEKINRRGRAIFLIIEDGADVPDELVDGRVDDVLVHPFRQLEVLGKLRHYQQILMWDEVVEMNASFSQLLDQMHDNLKIAERIQKNRFPIKFPKIKGFKVSSRYFAGMKSGGDHFDLAESRAGSHLSMVMTDASSYGLSSAVLSVLMKVAMKLSNEQARSCLETVNCIYEELSLVLGEKDQLSLFYGSLARTDYRLKFVNMGTSCGFYARPGEKFKPLPIQGPALTKKFTPKQLVREGEIVFEPGSRLALISDGFLEAVGGEKKLVQLLNDKREDEALDSLNEMAFQLKKGFEAPDDMPTQDCSAVFFDADAKLLRLAG
ncbi:MAG: SpoIIE family protein phosphatase [Bdellovibrionota bacterium]